MLLRKHIGWKPTLNIIEKNSKINKTLIEYIYIHIFIRLKIDFRVVVDFLKLYTLGVLGLSSSILVCVLIGDILPIGLIGLRFID